MVEPLILVRWFINSLFHCFADSLWFIDSLNRWFIDLEIIEYSIRWSINSLIYWNHCFSDSVIVDWLIQWSIHRFKDSLIHRNLWLIHCFIHSLSHWCIESFIIGSLNHWFIVSLTQWFSDSLICWFTDSLIHWFIGLFRGLCVDSVKSFHYISLAPQLPPAQSLIHLATSSLHCLCISKFCLKAIDFL